MKLKISESKIRQIVNEEVLKNTLNKTITEQKWPSYSAYLLAEILMLEYSAAVEKMGKEMDYDDQGLAEWVAKNASAYGLPDSDVQEAKEILGQSNRAGQSSTGEGVGGFLKAIAKPYQNIWKTFTNITQHSADFTDPEAKKAAGVVDQVDDKIPAPEKLQNQDPEDVRALMRQILDLLQKADQATDLDDIKPGLEDEIDQAVDQIDTAVDQAGGEEGGEEAGGAAVSVFRGKGGKGLQSFLDRSKSGVPGKVYGAILKHVANNLKQQGVTVTESVLDDVQGWIWYGLVEGAVRDQHGEAALNEITNEEVAMGPTIGRAPGAQAGAEAGAEGGEASGPVIQIYKGKKGVGLQSWMDMNREKLGIDDTAVKVLLMTVEDWAKANNLRVEALSHKMLGRVLPEVLSRHKIRKLQEVIYKLRS